MMKPDHEHPNTVLGGILVTLVTLPAFWQKRSGSVFSFTVIQGAQDGQHSLAGTFGAHNKLENYAVQLSAYAYWHPNKPIVDLPHLQNPLAKIDLIDIEAAQPPEEDHHWKLFQDSCRYRGLAGALNHFPGDLKGQYEEAVKAVSGTLWQPEKLWSTWPEVVEKSSLLP